MSENEKPASIIAAFETAQKSMIESYEALIRSVLDDGKPQRFTLIQKLASQAEGVLQLSGKRVADFDGQVDDDDGIGGDYLGAIPALFNPPGMRRADDSQDLLRTLIDQIKTLGEAQSAPKPIPLAVELNELSTVLEKVRGMYLVECNRHFEERDKSVIERLLQAEQAVWNKVNILLEDLNAVVPADVLRGHPMRADGGEVAGDPRAVAAPDGD